MRITAYEPLNHTRRRDIENIRGMNEKRYFRQFANR